MLEDVKIVDGDRLVIWDQDGQVALDLPLLALQPFNPGICATELVKELLHHESYNVVPIQDLAVMAAEAAKKIRDILAE